MKLNLKNKLRFRLSAVWAARIAIGITFIISGWAKAIDPWGFIYKVEEYLSVWNFDVPREITLTGCVALAVVEFSTGAHIATGCFKRLAVWVAAAMMFFMLPLTLYIALASPVSDCGCFGDFLILDNWTTFWKNVVISALIVYLIYRNRVVKGLFPAAIQWLVATVSIAFPLFLAIIGYNIQPIMDFRPFEISTQIFRPDGQEIEEDDNLLFIYEKDGLSKSFKLDQLPDSTWTFISSENLSDDSRQIAVYDENGDDVSADLAISPKDCLYLLIIDPGIQFLSRAHFINDLADYLKSRNVDMVAVVAGNDQAVENWKELVRPRFPVYYAEDTSLKELARGDAAVVYTKEGIIAWKRTLASLDVDLTRDSSGNTLSNISAIDDGRLHAILWGLYLAAMIIIYFLGLSPKILRLAMTRNSIKNS